MALASTDLLIVSRAEESYKVPASEIKSFILGSAGGGVPEFVGNAASATKLQTPRLINGTAFDGTADIVTDYWGDTITINDASVNGSGNVFLNVSNSTSNSNSNFMLTFVSATGFEELYTEPGLAYNPALRRLIATTFVGDLQGTATNSQNSTNATNATYADNVLVEQDNTTDASRYVNFSDGPSGYQEINTDNDLRYNPGQNSLNCGTFNGSFVGNGSGITNLNASNLSSGTVPSARLSGTYDIDISGSAANSPKLDGLDSTHFLRSDVADSKDFGALTFKDNVQCNFGDSGDARFYFNSTNFLLDLQSSASNLLIRDGSNVRFTFNRDGNFTATADVTAFSDITLKEDIRPIENALDKVQQILGVTYNRKDLDGQRQAGVIAQDVEKVLPEVVHTNEDGIKSVAYGNMIGLLIEAIKEQQRQIDDLKGNV